MVDRTVDFERVKASLSETAISTGDGFIVCQEDSLEALKRVPTASVNLILTDPPYHSTKKSNIYGDTAFNEDQHFLEWMEQYTVEWKRILKTNGTVYVFCSTAMSARLEVMMSQYFRPINHIAWSKPNEPGYDGWKGKMKKEALRTWYPHSERILVFEHGTYGSRTATRRSPLGQYLLDCRKAAGLTAKQLTEAIGAYGKVNNGGAVSNWEAGRNIPSRDQYNKMVVALEGTGKIEPMLQYEDIVRPMNVDPRAEFTDVWDFMSVRPFAGKHPAEKPQDMLQHIIRTSSWEGDIVLDCFSGSGSTGVAARRTNRLAVCIDIDEQWSERSANEVAAAHPGEDYEEPVRVSHLTGRRRTKDLNGVGSLFD